MSHLMPNLVQTFVDANGAPLDGGKVYFYEAGTSTPLATYQDQAEATPNTNPVILDANGQANIWLKNQAYKIVLADADDNILITRDVVTHIATGSILTALLEDDAVTTVKILNSAVTTAKIDDEAVTNQKIGPDAVNGTKIADDSIDSEHYVDGSIDAAHLASDSVTTVKILDSNVTTAKINDSAVTTAKINDSAVTTAKVNDLAVTPPKRSLTRQISTLNTSLSGISVTQALFNYTTTGSSRGIIIKMIGGEWDSAATANYTLQRSPDNSNWTTIMDCDSTFTITNSFGASPGVAPAAGTFNLGSGVYASNGVSFVIVDTGITTAGTYYYRWGHGSSATTTWTNCVFLIEEF